jgi:hypothetical protein
MGELLLAGRAGGPGGAPGVPPTFDHHLDVARRELVQALRASARPAPPANLTLPSDGTESVSQEAMKRRLACLDASQCAPPVLATAVTLARSTGAKVRLFRAVSLPSKVPPKLYAARRPPMPCVGRRQPGDRLTWCASLATWRVGDTAAYEASAIDYDQVVGALTACRALPGSVAIGPIPSCGESCIAVPDRACNGLPRQRAKRGPAFRSVGQLWRSRRSDAIPTSSCKPELSVSAFVNRA